MTIHQREIKPAHIVADRESDLGQEYFFIAETAVSRDDIVVVTDFGSSHARVVRADADALATSRGPIFVARHAAAAGGAVRCTSMALLVGVNTGTAAEGDPVWLSSTAGAWTLTAPAIAAARRRRIVGVVVGPGSTTAGRVLLCPKWAQEGFGDVTGGATGNFSRAALADADATLTDAEHMGGILSMTPGAGRTLTTRTAAQLVAAYGAHAAGLVADLTVVNLSGVNTITMAAGAGVTIIGSAVVAVSTSARYLQLFTDVTAAAEAVDFVRA